METSKNSTRQLTLDELISLQEGSPANPTLLPESERERRTSATCGPRCCALFENAPRATSWAKTYAGLLVGMTGWFSKRCVLTWKLKGTAYNRSYFQLQVSAPPTDGIESGLLPTPTTDERDAKYKQRGTNLRAAIKMLPTPTTRDYKGANSMEHLTRESNNRNHHDQLPNAVKLATGKDSQLNPLFVEEMMGFPKNWTASPFRDGDEKA